MKEQHKLSIKPKRVLWFALLLIGLLSFGTIFSGFVLPIQIVRSSGGNRQNTAFSPFYDRLKDSRRISGPENTGNAGPRIARTAPGEIAFSFSGYANPQRPFPGYQGSFQLGPVRISGDGVVRAKDGKLIKGGFISHSDDLLAGRNPRHRTNWQVVRGLGVTSKSGVTELRLLVKVTSTNQPSTCPVGTTGVVTLIDDNRKMSNRQTRDSIKTEMPNPSKIAADGGAACRTHVHGMNNVNHTWTDPNFGGPGGGNRANVSIKVEAENIGLCNIAGSWRQTTRGVNTTTWNFTHLGANRYRAVETGGGNARGTAVVKGQLLRLDATTGKLAGYYQWTLNPNCRFGSGKLVFTRGRKGTFTSTIARLAVTR
ncbi:MAG: hypothetical protein KDB79_07695 [Acidobacteria bacterium]|nr:hypothetical protein [Acidobacteriota bacterium]